MNTRTLRVPGKMFLAGEYAVLAGAPAVIAAVPPWASMEVRAGDRGFAGRWPGAPAPAPGLSPVDTSAFFAGPRKLGYGSSAAAATLQAAWPATLPDWQRAQVRHGELRGATGSGGDVAAMLHGGVGVFRPAAEGAAPLWQPLAWPAGASLLVVEAAEATDTRLQVARFRAALEKTDGQAWLADATAAVEALAQPDADWNAALQAAAAVYRRLRAWLGDDLYPPLFERCHVQAADFGLAFKPSGAGGGDIAFFFLPAGFDAAPLRAGLADTGARLRQLQPTRLGLHATQRLAPPWPAWSEAASDAAGACDWSWP